MSNSSLISMFRLADVISTYQGDRDHAVELAGLSVEAVRDATRPQTLRLPETVLKLEEMVVLCWQSVNEARASAAEWLSIVSSVQSLRVTKCNLEFEIEQWDVHKQAELDSSERSILASIDTVAAYAKNELERCDNFTKYRERFFDAATREMARSAVLTTATPTFKRDPIAGQGLPYANTSDPALKKFGNGVVYEQAVEAQIWLQGTTTNMGDTQIKNQANECIASSRAISTSVLALEAQLEAIDAVRRSAIARVNSLRMQLDAVQARMNSAEIDWKERVRGLLMRYSAATGKLGAFSGPLAACLHNVNPGLVPADRIQRFLDLATPGQVTIGANLEEVMVFLNDVEAWLVALQLRSVSRRIVTRVRVAMDGGKGEADFLMDPATFALVGNARLRGISVTCIDPPAGFYTATVVAPALGNRPSNFGGPVDQAEVGEVELGRLRSAASDAVELIYGASQCWNASPFGAWKLKITEHAAALSAQSVETLIVFHIDVSATS